MHDVLHHKQPHAALTEHDHQSAVVTHDGENGLQLSYGMQAELSIEILARHTSTFKPTLLPAFCTMPAMSFTLNCSVNWLKTRISPRCAGLSMASWMHLTYSRALHWSHSWQ